MSRLSIEEINRRVAMSQAASQRRRVQPRKTSKLEIAGGVVIMLLAFSITGAIILWL